MSTPKNYSYCDILNDRKIRCNGTVFESTALITYDDMFFWIYLSVYVVLVIIAGLVAGLTLALLSMDVIDVQVLAEAGTDEERKMAKKILPLVRRRHLLLVTLVLANSACVETMPLMMDTFASTAVSVVVSTTAVLIFGEVLPQAICSKKGLQVGSNCRGFVWFLIGAFFPIAYPFAKLLDRILGPGQAKFYNRGELKKLVELHAEKEAEVEEVDYAPKKRTDPLTNDEVTIIAGVLEMRYKTAARCMISIDKVFMIDYKSKMNRENMQKIMLTTHSRVPVYREDRNDIIGFLIVKNMLLSDWNTSDITFEDFIKDPSWSAFRRVRYVSKDINLLELLNLFQTGKSHLCVVVEIEAFFR